MVVAASGATHAAVRFAIFRPPRLSAACQSDTVTRRCLSRPVLDVEHSLKVPAPVLPQADAFPIVRAKVFCMRRAFFIEQIGMVLPFAELRGVGQI